MQVSTKPRLEEKESLHTLSAPKYTSEELGFCYHYIGHLKGKDLETGLCLSFCCFFSPFSSSLAYLNFASERPNQISHAGLLHTYLISRQQLWENAFPTCSAVLKTLSRFCSYFRIHHSERRFRGSLPLVAVQLSAKWGGSCGCEGWHWERQGSQREITRFPWKGLAGVAFLQKV